MMIRISLAGRGSFPIWWLERLTIREFIRWSSDIVDELDNITAQMQQS